MFENTVLNYPVLTFFVNQVEGKSNQLSDLVRNISKHLRERHGGTEERCLHVAAAILVQAANVEREELYSSQMATEEEKDFYVAEMTAPQTVNSLLIELTGTRTLLNDISNLQYGDEWLITQYHTDSIYSDLI